MHVYRWAAAALAVLAFGVSASAASARDCSNVALGATASASSTFSPQYAVSAVNNGTRDTGYTRTYWNDGTQGTYPDWAEIHWDSDVELQRVVVRGGGQSC